MANASGISSQSTPDREEHKSVECPPDNKLPENSQENLDARLDHAIEETFPTSDPVSVTITKGPEPDRADQEARFSAADAQQDSAEHVLDQVREVLHEVADQASGTARDIYGQGRRYVRQAAERYPEAERYASEGHSLVSRYTAANPLLSLLMAGAIGYALAWMIHGQRRGHDEHIPDYGRTNRGYAPHRGDPRL
jgi:ElaB/YqjD/DUF883 family membrane-anchored ribosome-binding protein